MSPAPIRTTPPPAGGMVGGAVARGVGVGGPRVDVAVGVAVARGVAVGGPRLNVAVGRPPAVAVDVPVDPDGLGPNELGAPEALGAPVAAIEASNEGLPAGRPVGSLAGPGLAQAHATMTRMPTVAIPAAVRRGCARATDWMGNLLVRFSPGQEAGTIARLKLPPPATATTCRLDGTLLSRAPSPQATTEPSDLSARLWLEWTRAGSAAVEPASA